MKGMVFTEFIEYIEDSFGFDICDDMLEGKQPYTQGGNYNFGELVDMIMIVHKATNEPVDRLLFEFGKFMFTKLSTMAPHFLSEHKTSLEYIANVDKYVHVEVKKLYPDADLPKFEIEEQSDTRLVMRYVSQKALDRFAEGIMRSCVEHYKESVDIKLENISEEPHITRFTLEMNNG
jgi:hypothetical protein